MLKTRIIAVLNIYNGIIVQSISFRKYLPVGKPKIAIDFLDSWGIDEIVLLNINNNKNSKKQFFDNLHSYTKNCQTPIAAGGGVSKEKDIEKIISNGADKVVINSSAHGDPSIIRTGEKLFGKQAVVVSIDVKKINNQFQVFTHSGTKKINMDLKNAIWQAQDNGAGELLINSINNDGKKNGYDIKLIQYVKKYANIPIIICGGVGKVNHFRDVLDYNLSGLAAGNFYHYTEHSVITLKQQLSREKRKIRIDTISNYKQKKFDKDGRQLPMKESEFDNLKFKFLKEEII